MCIQYHRRRVEFNGTYRRMEDALSPLKRLRESPPRDSRARVRISRYTRVRERDEDNRASCTSSLLFARSGAAIPENGLNGFRNCVASLPLLPRSLSLCLSLTLPLYLCFTRRMPR